MKCPKCNKPLKENTEGNLRYCQGHVPRWIDAHSVNCYFCGVLFDERDGQNADQYNGNDGGTICTDCIKIHERIDTL